MSFADSRKNIQKYFIKHFLDNMFGGEVIKGWFFLKTGVGKARQHDR